VRQKTKAKPAHLYDCISANELGAELIDCRLQSWPPQVPLFGPDSQEHNTWNRFATSEHSLTEAIVQRQQQPIFLSCPDGHRIVICAVIDFEDMNYVVADTAETRNNVWRDAFVSQPAHFGAQPYTSRSSAM
jgi:hypothetical protein